MPYTTLGRNLMLAAYAGTNPTAQTTHVGLFTSTSQSGITGVTSTDILTKTAHGLSNGDVAIPSALTGGSGLVSGDVYYVIGVTTNTFQLALTPGGAAVDLGTDVTAMTLTKLTEVTGGAPAYARKAIAWSAPAGGVLDDSTNGAVFDVPGGITVTHQGDFSALTAGQLNAVADIVDEAFAGQGTYTVTDAKRNLTS
jgi:hypothetical protein